ncbi:hypothetical protein Tco_0920406, partial [Tanacetum coccineum]
NIRVISVTMKMEILLEPTSNKLMVEHAEFDESDTYVLERFDTSAGNPVKEILLKLNLSDHRWSWSDEALKSKNFKEISVTLITERFSQSDEVLKLKNFKKDASLKLSSYQIKKGMSMSVQKSRVHKMEKFTRWRKEIMLG